MTELDELREMRREVERYAAELRVSSRTREGFEAADRLERITARRVEQAA